MHQLAGPAYELAAFFLFSNGPHFFLHGNMAGRKLDARVFIELFERISCRRRRATTRLRPLASP